MLQITAWGVGLQARPFLVTRCYRHIATEFDLPNVGCVACCERVAPYRAVRHGNYMRGGAAANSAQTSQHKHPQYIDALARNNSHRSQRLRLQTTE